MKKWIGYEFESGPVPTEDYKQFQKDYRSYLRKFCNKNGYMLYSFNKNHYKFTAVLKKLGKYYYFSISDVRFWQDEWYNNILIRTMEHPLDWKGGRNRYSSLENLKEALLLLEVHDIFEKIHR